MFLRGTNFLLQNFNIVRIATVLLKRLFAQCWNFEAKNWFHEETKKIIQRHVERKNHFFCYFVFVSLRERMGGWRKVCIKNLRLRRNVQVSKETGRGPKNSVFYEPPTFSYKFAKGKTQFFLLATYFFRKIREKKNSLFY